MKFIDNRYVIKIPEEISVIYSEKSRKILITHKFKKNLLDIKIKLKVLKHKNCIIVTDLPFLKTSSNLKKKKIIQGETFFSIKKAFSDIKRVTFKKLKLVGVGYKVFEITNKNLSNKLLNFKLGYSHNIYIKIPNNIETITKQSNKLFVSGYNSKLISKISSTIKNYKTPDPYKGKGVLYFNEVIKLKEGKKI